MRWISHVVAHTRVFTSGFAVGALPLSQGLAPADTFAPLPAAAEFSALGFMQPALFAQVRGHSGTRPEGCGQACMRYMTKGTRQLVCTPCADLESFLKANCKQFANGAPVQVKVADCRTFLDTAPRAKVDPPTMPAGTVALQSFLLTVFAWLNPSDCAIEPHHGVARVLIQFTRGTLRGTRIGVVPWRGFRMSEPLSLQDGMGQFGWWWGLAWTCIAVWFVLDVLVVAGVLIVRLAPLLFA